jgi:hypothetical protein
VVVERVIGPNAGCAAVLQQATACRGALHSLITEVVEDHIHGVAPLVRSLTWPVAEAMPCAISSMRVAAVSDSYRPVRRESSDLFRQLPCPPPGLISVR